MKPSKETLRQYQGKYFECEDICIHIIKIVSQNHDNGLFACIVEIIYKYSPVNNYRNDMTYVLSKEYLEGNNFVRIKKSEFYNKIKR